ncbi:MAG: glycosyltransferase [Bdellovibrionaceae bacterium]|nr:glycosyltransferase [Pseudobdellovibrionaceae bacterium]|tara:strand:+ start:738 stop:1505 length:768 start_codon:yes stop_codon:yes gene_type:complete
MNFIEKRINLFDLPMDPLSMEETLLSCEQIIESRSGPKQHMVVNAAKVVKCKNDPWLKKSVIQSDLINIDGQSVVWAARLLGFSVPERVAGIDLMMRLIEKAQDKKWPVYFLGAKSNVLEMMIKSLKRRYPELKIAGFDHGYFNSEEEIVKNISRSGAKILFVGMPTPKKEIFVEKNLKKLNVPFCMGVGGSFDVIAGIVQRAPVWIQKLGLEWFYRLIQEPRRLFMRYAVTNTIFISYVLLEWFKVKKRQLMRK